MANRKWQMARTEEPRPKINSTSSVSAGALKPKDASGGGGGDVAKKGGRLYKLYVAKPNAFGIPSFDWLVGFCLPSAIYASVKCQVLKFEFGLVSPHTHILTHPYTSLHLHTHSYPCKTKGNWEQRQIEGARGKQKNKQAHPGLHASINNWKIYIPRIYPT